MLTNFIQSSRLEPRFRKGVHRASFTKLTGKYWCWSLFLIKLKAQSLQLWRKDFDTGVFLWNLEKEEHLFYKTPSRGSHLEVFSKKRSSYKFRQIQRKTNTWMQLYFKETPAPAFSSEFCKIFRNTYFVEHLLTVTSDFRTAFSIQARAKNN